MVTSTLDVVYGIALWIRVVCPADNVTLSERLRSHRIAWTNRIVSISGKETKNLANVLFSNSVTPFLLLISYCYDVARLSSCSLVVHPQLNRLDERYVG